MSNYHVPRVSWQRFIDEFSREHDGALVTIEVMTVDRGTQVEARGLPLSGVTSDLARAPAEIAVTVGRRAGAHVTHRITDPVSVMVEENEEGVVQALRMLASDGEELIVRLRVPVTMREEDVFFR